MRTICALGAVLAVALSFSRAGAFEITRDGKPAATIVIATRPTTAAGFAATELQYHVRKITGATLPIVTDDAQVAGPRILVGESAATQAMQLRGTDFKSQEYLIRFVPDTLVLMGRDADASDSKATSIPERVAGKFRKALKFNGKTDVFSVPDCGFNDEAGTMEAWVWIPAATSDRAGTILRLDGSDPWTYHILQRDAKSGFISYTTYDGKKGHGVRSKTLAEGWHHVVATHDANTGKMALFVNGVACGTSDYVKTTCRNTSLHIGGIGASGASTSAGNPFEGIIDEVRISKSVRDAKADGPYEPDPDTTLLFHFDETDGAPRDSASNTITSTPPGLFDDRGSLDAVYDFLERFCDVRWYAPTEIGLVCPATPTLSVTGADVRRSPAMIHRWITQTQLYMPGPPDKVSGRDVQVWKLRMRIGGQPFWVCHSFYGYYDRYLKDHPDWFAKGYPGRPPQMCYTNPEFIQQVIQDARDYFDTKVAKPGAAAMGDVFGLVPMDNSSWCKCPRCQAEMNAAEESNLQFNNGKASDYVFNFVNKVACEVRKTHPDKWIGALAYSSYAYYPVKVKPEPNVIVQLCLHTRNWWCPSMEVNDRKVLRQWREPDPDRPLYLWLYYCFPALNARSGHYNYFPGFFAHTVVPQMKMYRDANIRGIFMEHSSECGATYLMDQIEFYVTLKLADDPQLDGNKLIEEFFTRYYGAAAAPMKELYCRIEDTFSNPKNYPTDIQTSPGHQHQNDALAWVSLGTEERMQEFAKLMAQAREAAKTPVEKERVAMFEKGIWDYMIAGRRNYDEHKKRKAEAIPSINVPRLAAEAAGDPAKVDWTKALNMGAWSTLAGDATSRQIRSLIAHDGKYLYVQLSEQLDPKRLVAGPDIWDGDDWEAFFAAKRGDTVCRQICIGPTGKHVALARGEEFSEWESGAAVALDNSEPGRWTVRLALPLDKLVPGGVQPGAKLYANLYRASPGASDLLAWTPNFANGFHDTSRLPELTLK